MIYEGHTGYVKVILYVYIYIYVGLYWVTWGYIGEIWGYTVWGL